MVSKFGKIDLPVNNAGMAKCVRAVADGLLDYCAGQVINCDGGFSMRVL